MDAHQATSSMGGLAWDHRSRSRNALPLRSWITRHASSSAGKVAKDGNAVVRASRSAGAGDCPLVHATSTRSAVSIMCASELIAFLKPI